MALTDEEKKRRACERTRRWKAANPDRDKKRKREWARKNPQDRRKRVLQQKFGLTLAEYDAMLAEQGGGCKICSKTPEQEGNCLAVDHCHESGKVRGILCRQCNTQLAVLEKDPQKLQRMIDYLEHHKETPANP